jgi:hypothetical protein
MTRKKKKNLYDSGVDEFIDSINEMKKSAKSDTPSFFNLNINKTLESSTDNSLSNSTDNSLSSSTDNSLSSSTYNSLSSSTDNSLDKTLTKNIQPIVIENKTDYILFKAISMTNGRLTSRESLSKSLGLNIETLKSALKRLKKKGLFSDYGRVKQGASWRLYFCVDKKIKVVTPLDIKKDGDVVLKKIKKTDVIIKKISI